jgi:hypothetical protein
MHRGHLSHFSTEFITANEQFSEIKGILSHLQTPSRSVPLKCFKVVFLHFAHWGVKEEL